MNDYPWHAPVLSRIRDSLHANRLPHAIVLTCNAGWGHVDLLGRAANLLLGVAADADTASLAHPDLRWVEPDGAVIKIDQVRALTYFAAQTAQIAPRKVAAVVDAHTMNVAAANALLKVLEEPPPHTCLLLATSHWGRLLPTIRSRCQRFAVRHDRREAQAWLRARGVEVEDSELAGLFAELGYAPLPVAELTESNEHAALRDWLSAASQQSLAAVVEPALKQDPVDWLSRWYRQVLAHLQSPVLPGVNADAVALVQFADELLDVRRQIATTNAANVRLLLERLVVRWRSLSRT